jgi:hypothetical protein
VARSVKSRSNDVYAMLGKGRRIEAWEQGMGKTYEPGEFEQ